jgi:hypothetical protein
MTYGKWGQTPFKRCAGGKWCLPYSVPTEIQQAILALIFFAIASPSPQWNPSSNKLKGSGSLFSEGGSEKIVLDGQSACKL